ncbi:MAG: tetratricopeptide repeat protein [Candidatus Melainabacteria bacterium]|nr:tetratricopeptide repeat protein [Candidatus Melainabacteria bacterium]
MKLETITELERFLNIQEQALGSDSPEVANTLTRLADLYFSKGLLEEAEALYRRALNIKEQSSGLHKIDIERTRQNLEKVLTRKRAPSQSRTPSSHVQWQTDSSTSLDAVPPSMALGWPSAFDQDKDKELEIELASIKHMMGLEHPQVADCLTRIADQYCRNKRYTEMEPVLQEALRIRERALGAEHPLVSSSLKNLARLYYFQKRYELSEPLFKRALSIRQKAYGKNHERYADVEEQYAKLLRKTGRALLAQDLDDHVKQVRSGRR